MRIGLTYDLREAYLKMGFGEEETGEFDRPDTIVSIDNALVALGHKTDRIGNLWDLLPRLVAGERWDIVFNIAEGLHGIARESTIPAVLDAYQIPYTFSDPLVTAVSLHKAYTKQAVMAHGLPTAPYFVLDMPPMKKDSDLDVVGTDSFPFPWEDEELSFPLFIKPVAEGTGKGITGKSVINSRDDLDRLSLALLKKYRQPVLVETYLPGREFTVGIVGTGKKARSVGIIEILLREDKTPGVYSYENKEKCEDLIDYVRADDPEALQAVEIALAAWKALGCRDGGRIDMKSDADGLPHFIEVNPLAGLHPQHSDLPIICTHNGISYNELIGAILDSAMERIPLTPPRLPRPASN